MRQSHPVLYVAVFETVAISGGSATTQVNFNDSGVIRGLTYESMDSDGVPIGDTATLNIYRQNQKGLTTEPLLVNTFCANLANGASPYTLASLMGDFRVNELDQLVFTLVNKSTSTEIAVAHVTIWLEADGPR